MFDFLASYSTLQMYDILHQGFNSLTIKFPQLLSELITTTLSDQPIVKQNLVCNGLDKHWGTNIYVSELKDFRLFNIKFQ
jgi:hypothetical protein